VVSTVLSATEIVATTPPGVLGPADVVVTNPDGQFATLAGGFTYVDDSPSHGANVFTFTGSNQYFVVPTGVSSVTVKMWGAGGEAGYYDGCDDGAGGAAGYVSGTLSVTPGETLTIRVGGAAQGNLWSPGWPNGGGGTIDKVKIGRRVYIFGMNGGGGGSSSVLRAGTVLIEAGGGNGGAGCTDPIAGGGIRPCLNPGNQVGASYNIMPGAGGGGYCGGWEFAGGSSFVPGGGVEVAGVGSAAANSADPDRGSAGQGAIPGNSAATHGVVRISW
jgi:hypothetical protein